MRFVVWAAVVQRCAKLAKYEENSPYYAVAMRYIKRVRDRLMKVANDTADRDYWMLYGIVKQMSEKLTFKSKTELFREYFERSECES